MAQMHKSVATLRIMGDDIVPADISSLLNCTPTKSRKKGDAIIGEKTGTKSIARTGMWSLCSVEQEPENLDRQIEEILANLTANMKTWQMLARAYRVDIFCGLFMHRENEGFAISPASLLALGQRGITLSFDVYGPD
jgi:hypothetical protein